MLSSSSWASRNLVSPVPQTKTSAVAPAVHTLTLLPSYNVLVCNKLSVSKKEIIDALYDETKTRDSAFSCSKKILLDSLIPIIEKQDRFFKYFEKIDKENAADDSTSASSLKSSLAVEFPFVVSSNGKVTFNIHKLSLNHLNKQEIATKMVNTYKIFELAKVSCHFCQVEKFTTKLDDIINKTIEHNTEKNWRSRNWYSTWQEKKSESTSKEISSGWRLLTRGWMLLDLHFL